MFSPLSQVSIPFPAAAPDALRAPILVGNRNVPFSNHLRRRKKLTGISEEAKPNSRCRAQLADFAPATAAAYGVLLFSGGLFAYVATVACSYQIRKGYGGITGAALMASAYILMQAPENKAAGDALGFGSAFLFSSVFGIRLVATRKLIPSGPLLALSLSALAVFVSAYLKHSA